MRKVFYVLVALVVVALALPALNLIVARPTGTSLTTQSGATAHAGLVAAILEANCTNCHSTEGKRPLYAGLPIARTAIRNDVQEALQALDLTADFDPGTGEPIDEALLAKIEYQIDTKAMPPGRYRAMHWQSHLHDGERAVLHDWIGSIRAAHYAPTEYEWAVRERVIQPLPRSVEVDPLKAALGEQLYHDTRLSGDNTISCASCHDLARGGADGQRFSDGIGGRLGGINSPTTFNSAFQTSQFWDGRAASLEEQADGPPNNPIEMGSSWAEIVAKLQKDAEFTRRFREAYPQGWSKESISDAISEFERTLVTPNSRFDRYLIGDVGALANDERHGWDLFQWNGCQSCHMGKLLGGQSYEVMGRRADYFGERGGVGPADLGRFNVTHDPADRHRFKVPTLRNVALTAPYLHDGSAPDLRAAVRAMAKYQVGRELREADVDALVRFLESLTGEYRGKQL